MATPKSKPLAPVTPADSPKEFLIRVFRTYRNRQPPEPAVNAITGIPMAVASLRVLTGLTREDLARQLSMSTNNLTNLEVRGKPIRYDQLERMRAFAQNACLYNLREFFDIAARSERQKIRQRQVQEPGMYD
jgi:hypothetical protein